ERHGFGFVRLGHQHRVAAEHHGLVLQLVPVDPGEDFGQPRVGDAVGDPVQEVQVAGLLRLLVGVHHAYALRADRELHLRAAVSRVAFSPDFAYGHVGAALPSGLDGGRVAQVEDRVGGAVSGDGQLLLPGPEHVSEAVQDAVGGRTGRRSQRAGAFTSADKLAFMQLHRFIHSRPDRVSPRYRWMRPSESTLCCPNAPRLDWT
uniref:Uncharacterized protein n=1 Tax=Denticeps clupeoides TaxID=299321 RepID=A0AAY4A3K9_9TELE